MMGVVRAVGEGTDEKGHPAVHQWNYCLGDSDFDITVEGETTHTKAGDFNLNSSRSTFYSSIAQPGKEVFCMYGMSSSQEAPGIIL